jgi:hypothetical protein
MPSTDHKAASVRRVVMGVSDWPEGDPDFKIVYVEDGETDAQAIQRAKSHYSDSLECYIIDEPAA